MSDNNIEFNDKSELYVLDYDVSKINDGDKISLQKLLADVSHMYTCAMRYMSHNKIINDIEGAKPLAIYLMRSGLVPLGASTIRQSKVSSLASPISFRELALGNWALRLAEETSRHFALPTLACCRCSRKRASRWTWWLALRPAAWWRPYSPLARMPRR